LLRRFESLIESIFAIKATTQALNYVRFKPIFNSYISCIEQFKSSFPHDYNQLRLEDISLYGKDGSEQFTAQKLSTLLHQSQAVVGVVKGFLPPALISNPGGTTVVVSAQAASQSLAHSTSQVQFTLILDGLSQAIQESNLDENSKSELINDIKELENEPLPNESKIISLATKIRSKLIVAIESLIPISDNHTLSAMPRGRRVYGRRFVISPLLYGD
jgi:hypothetical protein